MSTRFPLFRTLIALTVATLMVATPGIAGFLSASGAVSLDDRQGTAEADASAGAESDHAPTTDKPAGNEPARDQPPTRRDGRPPNQDAPARGDSSTDARPTPQPPALRNGPVCCDRPAPEPGNERPEREPPVRYGFHVAPHRQGIPAGEARGYDVILTNPGDAPIGIALDTAGMAKGWRAHLSEDRIRVPAGGEARIHLKVGAPADADHGEHEGWVLVRAVANGDTASTRYATAQAFLMTPPAKSGVFVNMTPDHLRVTPGTMAHLRFTLTNHGDAPDAGTLHLAVPDGMKARVQPAEFRLAPGESIRGIVNLSIGDDARSGPLALHAKAKSGAHAMDASFIEVARNNTTLEPRVKMALHGNHTAEAGGEHPLRLDVANLGRDAVRVHLAGENIPDGWRIRIDPGIVAVDGESTAHAKVLVGIPPCAAPGEYKLAIRGTTSDGSRPAFATMILHVTTADRACTMTSAGTP